MRPTETKAAAELAAHIKSKLATHRHLIQGLNEEIQQGVEQLLESATFEILTERFERLSILLRDTEDSLRQAAFASTGKAELLSASFQRFDGQVLSRIGGVDIHV